MAKHRGIYKPKFQASDGSIRQSKIWWISYRCRRCTIHPAGGRHRESTETEKITDAQLKLDQKKGAAANRNPILKESPVTMDELYKLVIADYRDSGRKTIEKVRGMWDNHLILFFGNLQAELVTTRDINSYKELRLSQGAKRATINNELAVVSKAFKLGLKSNIIRSKSCLIERYGESILNNARQGTLTEKEFKTLLQYLPDDVAAPIIFTYETGWRMNSEVLTRQWRHCNLETGEIFLESTETKNGEPRLFVFESGDPVMKALKRQKEIHSDLLKKNNLFVSYIFHHNGSPLFYYDEKRMSYRPSTYLRNAWEKARLKAGLPNTIVHDFRRVTISRYEDSGVSRKVAMLLTGHSTESVYKRYHIVKKEDYIQARRMVRNKAKKNVR